MGLKAEGMETEMDDGMMVMMLMVWWYGELVDRWLMM